MNIREQLKSGFTLIELMIVVAVIAILGTVVLVAYSGIQQNAKDKTILSDIDALDGIQTQYGLKNNVAGKAWYSGSGVDPDINFTPSPGNVIDIVVNSTDYCIRGYNPASGNSSIELSLVKESSDGACLTLPPSLASGYSGTIPAPTSVAAVVPGSYIQIDMSWDSVPSATTYRIEYSTVSDFSSSTFIDNISTTSRSITTLNAGTTYYLRVYAVSSGMLQSIASTSVSATTGMVSPP